MTVNTANWHIAEKAQTTPERYLESSIRITDTANKRGKAPPFNPNIGVASMRGWVYAAVWMNAKAVATTPLRMYVRKRAGEKLFGTRCLKKVDPKRRKHIRTRASSYVIQKTQEWNDDFEEVTEKHPIQTLLAKPNPYTPGFEFACMRHMLASLTGDYYMHPVLESMRFNGQGMNRIKELWTMPSQYVKIIPGDPKQEQLVAGYVYGADAQIQRTFAPDEVNHMKLPNPGSLFYGLGQVEAGWSVLRLSYAQRETDQARYDNLSRPDLAIITKSANVTQDKLVEMQNEWARLFRGTFRQGSPVFLTGDTQVIPLNWQPTEIGDREITTEEISAVFGVPVSLLKANDPNLASAQVGFASWREQTILPYCRMDEEFLNNSLLPVYGIEDDAFLCYDDPVPENRDELLKEAQAEQAGGWATKNETRQKMGMEPVEGEENADTLLVPSGYVPIDKVGEPMDLGGFGGGFGGSSGSGSSDAGDRASNRGAGDAGGVDNGESAPEPKRLSVGSGNERHARGIHIQRTQSNDSGNARILQSSHQYTVHKGDADDTAREGEKEKPIREMTRNLNAVFAKQCKEIKRVLVGKKMAIFDIGQILRVLHDTLPDIVEAVGPYMERQLLAGGVAGMDQIDLPPDTWDVVNPKVEAFIRHYSIKLAGEVNGYTTQKLAETLGEGLGAGESTSALAGRVGALYDDFSGNRSECIARTESARAYVQGSHEAWKESGVVTGKKWELAAGACEACRAAAAAYPDGVPLDQPFFHLGTQIPLPGGKHFLVDYSAVQGPPLHPNDRCQTVPVIVKVQE